MLKKAKQDLVITSLNDNHTNSRKFWKILNEDLGLKSKNVQDTCVQLRTGDGSTCEGQDLSNFLMHYATNGKLLAEGIPNTPPGTHEDCFPEIRTTFKFRFVPLTVIEKYINKIDITKSSGIPGIRTRLFKDAFKVLSVELTHIINESLDQAIFPDAWAIGTITPIPKGGDSHDPGNWRPITILPLPSKIMERAVHYQLINYFEENDYLHKNQHGFRKNCSTATAIFKLSRDLHSAYDLGYSTSCIFVDYKKAFETLRHKILMEEMHAYGLSQKSIRWLNSYLENRRHVVDCLMSPMEYLKAPFWGLVCLLFMLMTYCILWEKIMLPQFFFFFFFNFTTTSLT